MRIVPLSLLVVLVVALGIGLVVGAGPAGPESVEGAFPGVNGKIAFETDRDDPDPSSCGFACDFEIYVMDADGTSPTNLTNSAARDSNPAWSPAGTKIAFDTDRDGNNEVYVMDANGTNPTNLTNSADEDSNPAWSPDGTKIAFDTDRDGNVEVDVMDANGTNPTNLTNNATRDRKPDWQPLVAPPATATSTIPVVPAATATVAAAALPGTGASADGSGGGSALTWLIATLAGAGVVAAAGYGALRARRR